jgi:hypothetical protein
MLVSSHQTHQHRINAVESDHTKNQNAAMTLLLPFLLIFGFCHEFDSVDARVFVAQPSIDF